MKNNETERKCKICGKTIVGKNITGICSGCKKNGGDKTVKTLGIIGIIGSVIGVIVKAITKKD